MNGLVGSEQKLMIYFILSRENTMNIIEC